MIERDKLKTIPPPKYVAGDLVVFFWNNSAVVARVDSVNYTIHGWRLNIESIHLQEDKVLPYDPNLFKI